MPNYFYITYFSAEDAAAVRQLKKSLETLFFGKSYSFQEIPGKVGSFIYLSQAEILSGTINKIVETFRDNHVDVIYSHHTGSPLDTYKKFVPSQPSHVMSFILVLGKQTLADIIWFRRFFLVTNLTRILLKETGYKGFEVNGDNIVFYLQTQDPIKDYLIEFFEKTFQYHKVNYLKNIA
jgi:hypothetical protein